MTTALVTGALDVLIRTRRLFATTHWTTGAMVADRPTTGGNGDDYDDPNQPNKPCFCTIGGMRLATTTEITDDWLDALDSYDLGDGDFRHPAQSQPEMDEDAYVGALRALYAIVYPHKSQDLDGYVDELAYLEDQLIGWNDHYTHGDPQGRAAVLDAFDKAIASLTKEEGQ